MDRLFGVMIMAVWCLFPILLGNAIVIQENDLRGIIFYAVGLVPFMVLAILSLIYKD